MNDEESESESDYCEDLVEIYQILGGEQDAHFYKELHLMDKPEKDEEEGEPEKYFCPSTGSHFSIEDICSRLDFLKTKREALDI